MDIWMQLGIEKTNDIRVIKKAYARLLKQTHPEDDPEGYQRLRETYDKAIRWARNNKTSGNIINEQAGEPDHSHLNTYETDKQGDIHFANEAMSTLSEDDEFDSEKEEHLSSLRTNWQQTVIEESDPVEEFMEQTFHIYHNFAMRVELSNWIELMNHPAVWNISMQEVISELLLDFLEDHHYLPPAVWELLKNTFNWQRELEEDQAYFTNQYPRLYFHMFRASFETDEGYIWLSRYADQDMEHYLFCRSAAYSELMMGEMEQAASKIAEALEFVQDDADLLRIRIQYHILNGEQEQAIALCSGWLQNRPDDRTIHLLYFHLLKNNANMQEHEAYLLQLLERYPEEPMLQLASARFHMGREEWEMAESCCQAVLGQHPAHAEAILLLAEVQMRLLQQVTPDRRRRLNLELGRWTAFVRIKRFFGILLREKWPGLLTMALLCLVIVYTYQSTTGHSLGEYLNPTGTYEVKSGSELARLQPGDPVHAYAKGGTYTDMQLLNWVHGETFIMSSAKAKANNVLQASGYLYVVRLGQSSVPVSVNYETAMKLYNNQQAELIGNAYPLPPEQLNTIKKKMLGYASNSLEGYPLTSYYIQAKEGKAQSTLPPAPPTAKFYVLLILILFTMFLQGVYRAWRFSRY
ncbi:tetratricopeptide repeat protein [Paenibacillus dauci]|uniref:J domain-containing protein n=1 Tax=Paenibacillus dauci TaxID=1567106 RepID=UPI00061A0583|nr:J domain-containing protein [Paenibacillus dauci]